MSLLLFSLFLRVSFFISLWVKVFLNISIKKSFFPQKNVTPYRKKLKKVFLWEDILSGMSLSLGMRGTDVEVIFTSPHTLFSFSDSDILQGKKIRNIFLISISKNNFYIYINTYIS